VKTRVGPIRIVTTAVAWITLAVLSACEGTGPGFRSTSVEITPSTVVFDAIGADSLLRARVVDDRGRDQLGARVTWVSTDPAIAAVDGDGRVSAVSRGSTTVRATATGLGFIEASGTATIEVAPEVAAIAVVAGGGQTGIVGLALPSMVEVMATDRGGEPVVGQAVSFTPATGGGHASPTVADTDIRGIAASEWTLGPMAGGLHQLTVTVGGSALAPVQLEALALAGPPAMIDVETGGGQFGVRGQPLAEPVVVRVVDSFGNAIGGLDVAFSVSGSEGSVAPATTTTGLTGSASAAWTLGPAVGTQRLQIDARSASTVVDAVATEAPAAVQATSATNLTGTVGRPVAQAPSVIVVDAQGAPVPGVVVTFEVTAGGGTVETGQPSGASPAPQPTPPQAAPLRGRAGHLGSLAAPAAVQTDDEGRAAVAGWTLGAVAGASNQVLRASVEGVGNLIFTASAQAGPPAALTVLGGDSQTGPVTVALPDPISVRVADAFDNPVAGVEVGFSPSAGFAVPSSQTTDALGTASTRWTLGPLAGTHTLQASTMGSAAPVQVSGVGTGSSPTCALNAPGPAFDLQTCWVGAVDAQVATALDQAVARWEALVVGDVPDVAPNADHASCVAGAPWVSGPTLDDLVLYVTVESIDGPGGGLAGALPCFIREGSSLPTFARLRIDRDDVASLSADGQLVEVLLHEIGHALGFGTLWPMSGLLVEPAVGVTGPPPDTHFSGARAIDAFDGAGGVARTVGAKVPVQNRGGGGVVDVHWRESVFGPELMTSELNAGVSNPLSRVTVESLADIGYVVAADQSDAYLVPFPNFPVPGPRDAPTGTREMGQDIWWGPIGVVDAAGTLLGIHRFQHRR
jgi:hypothetical protein